jgi:hypothetical protein
MVWDMARIMVRDKAVDRDRDRASARFSAMASVSIRIRFRAIIRAGYRTRA